MPGQTLGQGMTQLEKYLQCLRDLGFVEREGDRTWLKDREYFAGVSDGKVTVGIGGTAGYSDFWSFMEFNEMTGELIAHGAVE
jgi:hypothetical protein